jgi:nitrate reductase delta subunit
MSATVTPDTLLVAEEGSAALDADMAMSYKIISLLLQYPGQDLLAETPVILGAVAALPEGNTKEALERFLAYRQEVGAVALQQEYVRTFDFQKRLSLYLTYYLHGDRRQRGMELLRLKRRYAAAGLPLAGSELPDYLPVLLEFAALAPMGYGQELLAEFRPAIELLRAALHDTGSPYAHLLDALCHALPVLTAEEQAEVRRLAAEGPPAEQVGLEPFAPPEVMPAPPPHPFGGGTFTAETRRRGDDPERKQDQRQSGKDAGNDPGLIRGAVR